MTTTQKITTEYDLLGIQLAHRAMRRDAARLVTLCEGLKSPDAKQMTAISEYVHLFADSIHHHHTTEDDVLWPKIVGSVGSHIDLSDLTEDHEALDPLLDELRAAADGLPESLARLTAALVQLKNELDEHIEDEERTIFPLITEHLPLAEWEAVENAARKGGKVDFELPRVIDVLSPDELVRVKKEGGVMLRIMLPFLRRKYRRREKACGLRA
ncbi:hemerythrin domain-containing protein [Rhodococcoides kyotonense]|uniref:Hemerythrin HHE cation binding domain-containing protein n=1 Tax=Rhodococcoides kyotonense TaxID=398843 RepID=A0A239JF68_9NOCA|nr:hemerythrin domain-containing protein [Rhodococcus kyotonensis]SNT04252.1 Hemerythrin HHE cation binding domain-containing protein [Rhodococcus kyotonensis]